MKVDDSAEIKLQKQKLHDGHVFHKPPIDIVFFLSN